MFIYEVIFGPVDKRNREESEDLAESYLAQLLHNGQANEKYFLVVKDGILIGYINLAGIKAHLLKYHSSYGKNYLQKFTVLFGKLPKWTSLDDEVPKQDITWNKASFLYLFTHMFNCESPLCRGDNGMPVGLYRLPCTYQDREDIYRWQFTYREFDSIWIGSSHLELPVYKQLAEPSSDLSQDGLKICQIIEKATGIPTYYFLLRHWGRRKDENKRKCPCCGRSWRTTHTEKSNIFWQFAFQCERCRLVSHIANDYDDQRRAVIGEFKVKNKKLKQK